MNDFELKHVIEATLLAAGKPVTLQQFQELFDERECPTPEQFQQAFVDLAADYQHRGLEVIEVASGWRIQIRPRMAEVVSRLWQERPSRYSRALLETLALVAYRQPITRSEIEEIRGVSISSTIMRTLQERGWIRTVGHREVPGRPELLGTTREFLDYFGLRSLEQLPTLAELKDLDNLGVQLELPSGEGAPDASQDAQQAAGEGEHPSAADEGGAGEGEGDVQASLDESAAASDELVQAAVETVDADVAAQAQDADESSVDSVVAGDAGDDADDGDDDLDEDDADADADADADDEDDDDDSDDEDDDLDEDDSDDDDDDLDEDDSDDEDDDLDDDDADADADDEDDDLDDDDSDDEDDDLDDDDSDDEDDDLDDDDSDDEDDDLDDDDADDDDDDDKQAVAGPAGGLSGRQ